MLLFWTKSRTMLIPTLTILLAAFAPRAEASPSYSIVDLGPAPNPSWGEPTYGSDAGGGLVFAADGSAYRFNPSTISPTSTDGLPLELSTYVAPSDQGNPAYRLNYVTEAYQNSNGLKVYFETASIADHPWDGNTGLIALPPGGTDPQAQARTLATGPSGENDIGLAGLNNLNQVLYQVHYGGYNGGYFSNSPHGPSTYIFDANTNTTIDLGALTAQSNHYMGIYLAYAIDDEGRVLASAVRTDDYSTDLLLLSPTNLADGPVSIPEPSLIAFAACVAAGMLIRETGRNKVSKRTTTG